MKFSSSFYLPSTHTRTFHHRPLAKAPYDYILYIAIFLSLKIKKSKFKEKKSMNIPIFTNCLESFARLCMCNCMQCYIMYTYKHIKTVEHR